MTREKFDYEKEAGALLEQTRAVLNEAIVAVATVADAVRNSRQRHEIVKLALEAAQRELAGVVTESSADAVTRYVLAVADKLAPAPREKQVIKPSDVGDAGQVLGYKLTDAEAQQVAEASK